VEKGNIEHIVKSSKKEIDMFPKIEAKA